MPYQTCSLEEALSRIRSEIDQLPDVVAMIADEPLQVRDLWHWQVENLLERVRVLSQQGRAGQMSEEQQREYSAMVRQLDGARTWIEALGWTVPSELGQSIEAVG
ncbi:MAG: hypothetical protein WBW04_22055 [Nitrolancea sp.]